MARLSPAVEHLLRRAGFGASPEDAARFARMTLPAAVAALVNYDPAATDIDSKIGTTGFVGITVRSPGFSPNTVINDSRQRWLFRMVHSPAPLQEKMTMFWHHHFATAYSKIQGIVGNAGAARMMAAKQSEDTTGMKGQIELLRENALGNFRDLLIAIAQDVAMLYWLDGRLNVRSQPQENFGRELMELFTFGVEHYVETDVYAAARAFTGWNVRFSGVADTATAHYAFQYNSGNHETSAKAFSFPIYEDGNKVIPARPASAGMQDGIDLINALAIHPETANRLARRLWTWFVSEVDAPDPAFVSSIAATYLNNDTNMKPVIRAVLLSPQFMDKSRYYQRYSWPVEFVVRSLKEVGRVGFSVDSAITPLLNMGQQLFEPPDVNGWELGPGWFSTGGMLARMNFASALATNQKFELRNAAQSSKSSPDALLNFALNRLSLSDPTSAVRTELINYVKAGGTWQGTDTQMLNKTAGLFHLLTGSGDYQLV